MKGSWSKRIMCCGAVVVASIVPGLAGEVLYNGIELPDVWPPRTEQLTREPMWVPYLEAPPHIIPIDVGRQLLVDDFLIEQTTLKRTYHRPKYYAGNPVLRPDKTWERGDTALAAAPFSDGVFYDPKDQLFKMWYMGGYIASTGLATMRRDGFASMDAGSESGTLTTRPVTFRGRYLFVNIDASGGELRVEVLDPNGKVMEPYTWADCQPL